MSAPVHTFVSVEEDKHTLTVHYRTEAGQPGSVTFHAGGASGGNRLRVVSVYGRHTQEIKIVDMFFAVEGATGVTILEVTDEHGNVVRKGAFVTHSIAVRLPDADAQRLSNQLYIFINPVEVLLESNATRRPVMDGISYGDDYIAVSYDSGYRAVRFGLVADQHRFTLAYYAVDFGESVGAVGMTFAFIDENGDQHRVSFSAPEADIWSMKLELDAFAKAFEDARRPKFEAAAISYVFQYAA